MGNTKPLGSERLQGDEKIKRILEIANYGKTTKPKAQTAEYISESVNGHVYGIVREKDAYYIKKGINESSLDYIGGMFMKNKNRFSSYSEALKRLNLISGQDNLTEGKRYVLKQKQVEPEAAPAPAPIAEPEVAPVDDGLPPVDDAEIGGGTEDDMGGEPPMDGEEPGMDDMGGEETGMEDGDGTDLRSSYMAEIQKFSGKLGQELRDQREKLESDDLKYVLNMIISAIDVDALDDDDVDDVVSKLENSRYSENDNNPSGLDGEPEMSAEPETEMAEEDKEQLMLGDKKTKSNNKSGGLNISDFSDLKEIEDEDEDVELDLDEIKKEINKNINGTLSKYFK